ncbi:MAG: mechanosensitive ion channel [Gammaproteobacteria bacterium]|nr:mechanosensitive ion channel [Gammaproteobacteria bacterium]
MLTEFFNHLSELTGLNKLFVLLISALVAHAVAKLIRFIGLHLSTSKQSDRAKTIFSLSVSVVVFTIYFVVIGIMLRELGVPLSTYIASASVIGIAVGFGTQNMVQDVINGLTIILTDLFTVGDMVEISGQTGIVRQVTMRFVVLVNPFGAFVYIPTRTVTNVINYPRGYVRCLVDISLANRDALLSFRESHLEKYVKGFTEQFSGTLIAEPEIEEIKTMSSGKHYLRVKFRIWPGRGSPIETTFKLDILDILKTIDQTADAMDIAVNYEIAKK